MASEFYTLATLGTLAGATGATVTVANTLKSVFGWSPRWLGLVIAQAVCLGVLLATGADHRSDWLIAVINGCIVHLAAAGTSAAGAALVARDGTGGAVSGDQAAAKRGIDHGARVRVAQPSQPNFWTRWY
jgi:hypothetical protein